MLRAALLVATLVRPDSATIVPNDNLASAGRVVNGAIHISLEMGIGKWPLRGPGRAAGTILAFAETGRALSIPGPLLRVKLGTKIVATVTNNWDRPLVVHGLSSRRTEVPDTLLIPAGGRATATFTTDAEGTYFYWAAEPGTAFADRDFLDSQLSGALIVDAPDAAPRTERILVISTWIQARLPDGAVDLMSEAFAINGRSWPQTERLTYDLGDSVHWRIINTSAGVHPMHLHGFFFRVNARGNDQRDTTYWPREQRLGVTERMDPGTTMRMSFLPDRPGGWLFHCHLNWHVVHNIGLGADRRASKVVNAELVSGKGHHGDPAKHVEEGMGGLMLGFRVRAPVRPVETEPRHRTLRLFIQARDAETDSSRYGFVIQEGDREPAADSVRMPGSTILLNRGEPTAIRVFNRTGHPTQVHWHGLELESPFDGVIGVGGFDGMPTPPIMPGDSFDVRVTPPRAGSYMYHTHVTEIHQQSRGMWGALLVVEPDQPFDRTRDLIFMTGEGPALGPYLNGNKPGSTLAPITLLPATSYRFRLMNLTMGGPLLQYWLTRAGTPVRWTPVARDGADLPPWQQDQKWARQMVGIGETHDMMVTLNVPGEYALELRRGNGAVITRQPIRVSPLFEPAQQIAAALLPLPADLRAGATVLGYRDTTSLVELRKGSNGMICLADDPTAPAFHVACYHQAMEPFMARGRALRDAGLKGEGVDSVRYAEVAAGTLSLPTGASALWQISASAGNWDPIANTVTGGRSLYVIYMPFATEATTGLPTTPQAAGRPWLMSAGTPKAHIMLVPSMATVPVVP